MRTGRFAWRRWAALTAVSITLPSLAAAATAPPDLTGVWTSYGARNISTGSDDPGFPLNFRPDAKVKVDEYRALVAPKGETPGGVCLGYGMPWSMLGSGGYPMEIVQRPEQITVIYELHGETRRVYFGARNAPPEDRVPGRNGYSSGRWDGDALVVETDNLVEQVDQRVPHSGNAKIVERYWLEKEKDKEGRRILNVEMTMTDPDFYPAPVVTRRQWAQVPNGRVLPYECGEEVWRKRLEELAAARKPR